MKTLFDPIRIGNLECKNRILRSSTWEALADEKGFMSEKQYEIYEQLAKNEIGLISTGYARVMEEDCPNAGMMGIYDDMFIPSYQKLTDLVHQHDGKIMMQIAYGGTKTTYKVGERRICAPSDIPEKSTGTQGHAMSLEDIRDLVEAHAQAARRVKESGFDAVQIHAGHGYLLNQFLSPYYNNREDQYGGSLENRARVILECYDAIRETVGKNYPVLIKLTCSDFAEEGFHFEECRKLCTMLAERGIDAIEVSGNIHGKAEKMIGQEFDQHVLTKNGFFIEYAKIIAQEQKIPVFVTGGYRDPKEMEQWLNDSEITGFGMCRSLISEPDLVSRWKSGERDKARCVFCSKCRTPEGNYCTTFERI